MAYGRFISALGSNSRLRFYLHKLVSVAHETSNEGLLWFYPNNYLLSRMLGQTLPSAIGQAQMLGGVTYASAINNGRFAQIAKKSFQGIAYDYYKGGVNLHNRAFLEIPLFRSAPEIVLNGWLHAIILVDYYADWSKDRDAQWLVRQNVEHLAATLSSYHDPKTGLSLYSDLGPYRLHISYTERVPNLHVYYDSRSDELDDIAVPLRSLGYPGTSPYDNQIIVQRAGYLQVSANCSQNYDTYLVSDVGGIEISLWTGRYDPKAATPAPGGEEIKLRSAERGKWHVVDLSSVRDRMFCGFPTNFAKRGKENEYHVYHIVALAYILATFDLEQDQIDSLKRWMMTWYETVENSVPAEDMYFTDYAKVLEGLAANHRQIRYRDWETLLRDAKSR